MQSTLVAQNCTSKSTLLDMKKGCASFTGEILPANRSSLSSDHGRIEGCESCDSSSTVLHKRRTVLSQEHDGVDLAYGCHLGEKSRDMPIAPCLTKKRRFIAGEYDLTQHCGNSNERSSSGTYLLNHTALILVCNSVNHDNSWTFVL